MLQEIFVPGLSPAMPVWNVLDDDGVRRKLIAIAEEGQDLMARCDREGRDLTDEEITRFDAILAEGKRLQGLLDVSEVASEFRVGVGRRTTAEGPTDRTGPRRQTVGIAPEVENSRDHLRLLQQRPLVGRYCKDLFGPAEQRSGFKNADEFYEIVFNNQYDPRLIRAAMGEGQGSTGGFSVPDEYAFATLDAALENELIRPRAQVYAMSSSHKMIGTFDDTTHAGGAVNGVALQWLGESTSMDLKQAKLKLTTLRAGKAGALVPVSNELLADGMNFSQQLSTALTNSLSFGLDHAFLQGTGGVMPLGILNSPALISVQKEVLQQADTIVWENLANMLARLHPGVLRGAIWIAHPSALPQLMALAVPIGVGGQLQAAVRENNNGFTLMTLPLFFSEKLNPLGDKGDILLCNPQFYLIGIRKEISLEVSGHYGFRTDETYFRVIARVAGQPAIGDPWQPMNSAPTLSAFITLDERA